MRSVTDPSIYAVGECAEHRGRTYGLVAPLWEQGQVLADHLSGLRPDAAYQGSREATTLKVMGIELASMGLTDAADAEDEVVQFAEPRRGVYKKLVIRGDRVVGAILLGDGAKAPYLMQAFDRGTPVPEERAALFFDLGNRPAVALEEMTDDSTVCHCNAVSKGDIRECVLGGASGIHDVMRATRACTGCGSCKSLVRTLLSRYNRAESLVGAGA
jgi:nitrite reductase (NADH) large subunit